MPKLRACFALCIATALTGSVTAASAAKNSGSLLAAKGSGAADHIPGFDGPMTTLVGPDGRTWAAWTYRASHEFDIAISSHDGSTTTWSAPVFIGRHSGSDDIDPVLAVDSRGAVYVAFATANPPRVAVATLAAGSTTWSEPLVISGTEAASAPALLVVGDRLIVAFMTAQGVGLVNLPTAGSGSQIEGIQDGPDPIGSVGAKGVPVGPNIPTGSSPRLP